MRLDVISSRWRGYQVRALPQDEFMSYPCPICGQDDRLQHIGSIQANGRTSLETAYCRRCSHRFHNRFPSSEWLASYYRDTFERHTPRPPFSIKEWLYRKPFVRKAHSRITTGHERTSRILDFCLAVLSSDGVYFDAKPELNRVLEIGCGFGANLQVFMDRGFQAYGIDANRVRVEHCQRNGMNVVHASESGSLSYPFDFIYSHHAIEHILDIDAHIRWISDIINPDGFLFIETPDISGDLLILSSIRFSIFTRSR